MKEVERDTIVNNQHSQVLIVRQLSETQRAASVSKADNPKVSIIMACHNAAGFLAETMDTILTQTLKEWELLVADDASTDQTRAMLEAYAARDSRIHLWLFDDNKGPYVRRNFMIEQARAPYICIHDADDLMAPNKLEVFHKEINSEEQLGIVGSFDRIFLDVFRGEEFCEDREYPITHQELIETIINFGCPWRHGSAIIRKSLFKAIGPFDEHPYGSDSFWLAKAGIYSFLTNQVTFRTVPLFLTYIRKHTQSQTSKISIIDPRSRRVRLKYFWTYKLQEVIHEFMTSPSTDVVQKLNECTCTEFIPKFGHLFEQWESVPVTDTMVQGLINNALRNFWSEQFVSTIITLNALDQMTPQVSRFYCHLNYIRGLAYYAIGDDKQAAINIKKISRIFRNKNVQAFSKLCLEPINPTLNSLQRRTNIRPFIKELSRLRPASYRVSYRNILASKLKNVYRYLNPVRYLKFLYVYFAIRRSDLFDRDFYFKQYRDMDYKCTNPIKHYLCYGWREGYNPNMLFDTEWYLQNYPDVAQSGINPLYHYLKFGWKQNKNPSRDFHTALYMLYHPDTERSGMNPLAHYFQHGQYKQYEIFTVLSNRAQKSVLRSRINDYNPLKAKYRENVKAPEPVKNNT